MFKGLYYDPVWMAVELVFAIVIIVLCMMIYFRTKELYTLTRHKGIRYFRNTFLFFALAFAFRFVFHLLGISGAGFNFHLPRELMGPLPLLVTGYFSTIAIFYLLFSLLWKKIAFRHFLVVSHVLALSVAIIVFLFRSPQILALVQLIIIVATLVLAYLRSRHSKSFSNLFGIYLLLFVGWLANIIVLSPRWVIPFEAKLVSYCISMAVFGAIFYKVYRWTRK